MDRPDLLRIAAGLACTATWSSWAAATDSPIFRCLASGRVAYQDAPCPVGAREGVVNNRPPAGLADAPPPKAAATAPARPERPPNLAEPSREALASIRVGMTSRELESLDPRLRNGRSRTIEANGRHHEWRYVAEDCVLHLADGVVVAIYR
ncbi:MAG TPA: hypothetical protein VGI14_11415 [Casimicrobiaceae bacterium]|jgi:hypothetical protein